MTLEQAKEYLSMLPISQPKRPSHHNARPPVKVRKHERRKFRNWWNRIAKHQCEPWRDLCTHRPNIHPEPDGA